jgi:signal transduction histidine kinase
VDLRKTIWEVGAITEPLAQKEGIRLRIEVPEGSLWAETDSRRVRQILVNLLSNAVKFTDEGEIELRARATADTVVLEVQDSGIGIRSEDRERIFDAFWQVEQSPTRRAGGTGLGLSVVRRLVDLLGGRISVESAVGRGSTFTVELPTRTAGLREGSLEVGAKAS